jgi:hypothetical protein
MLAKTIIGSIKICCKKPLNCKEITILFQKKYSTIAILLEKYYGSAPYLRIQVLVPKKRFYLYLRLKKTRPEIGL